MSEHPSTPNAATPDPKPRSRLGLLLAVVGAAALWLSGRLVWVRAEIIDDKAADVARNLDGATFSPLIAPAAMTIFAGVVALLVTRGWVARMVVVVMALMAVAASYPVAMTLVGGAAPAHVEELLRAQRSTTAILATQGINAWAQVSTTEVSYLPVLLAAVGVACALAGAVAMWLRPGWKPAGVDAYDTAARRRERLAAGNLAAEDLGDKDLWDSLDVGVDPTERAPRD